MCVGSALCVQYRRVGFKLPDCRCWQDGGLHQIHGPRHLLWWWRPLPCEVWEPWVKWVLQPALFVWLHLFWWSWGCDTQHALDTHILDTKVRKPNLIIFANCLFWAGLSSALEFNKTYFWSQNSQIAAKTLEFVVLVSNKIINPITSNFLFHSPPHFPIWCFVEAGVQMSGMESILPNAILCISHNDLFSHVHLKTSLQPSQALHAPQVSWQYLQVSFQTLLPQQSVGSFFPRCLLPWPWSIRSHWWESGMCNAEHPCSGARFGVGISLGLLPPSVYSSHKTEPTQKLWINFLPSDSFNTAQWILVLRDVWQQASTKHSLCVHLALISGGSQCSMGGFPLDRWGKQSG